MGGDARQKPSKLFYINYIRIVVTYVQIHTQTNASNTKINKSNNNICLPVPLAYKQVFAISSKEILLINHSDTTEKDRVEVDVKGHLLHTDFICLVDQQLEGAHQVPNLHTTWPYVVAEKGTYNTQLKCDWKYGSSLSYTLRHFAGAESTETDVRRLCALSYKCHTHACNMSGQCIAEKGQA